MRASRCVISARNTIRALMASTGVAAGTTLTSSMTPPRCLHPCDAEPHDTRLARHLPILRLALLSRLLLREQSFTLGFHMPAFRRAREVDGCTIRRGAVAGHDGGEVTVCQGFLPPPRWVVKHPLASIGLLALLRPSVMDRGAIAARLSLHILWQVRPRLHARCTRVDVQ